MISYRGRSAGRDERSFPRRVLQPHAASAQQTKARIESVESPSAFCASSVAHSRRERGSVGETRASRHAARTDADILWPASFAASRCIPSFRHVPLRLVGLRPFFSMPVLFSLPSFFFSFSLFGAFASYLGCVVGSWSSFCLLLLSSLPAPCPTASNPSLACPTRTLRLVWSRRLVGTETAGFVWRFASSTGSRAGWEHGEGRGKRGRVAKRKALQQLRRPRPRAANAMRSMEQGGCRFASSVGEIRWGGG